MVESEGGAMEGEERGYFGRTGHGSGGGGGGGRDLFYRVSF